MTQLISWVGLSLALFLFSLNSVWLAPFTAWVILGVAYFTLSYVANSTFKRFDLAAHDALVAQFADADPPSVDVFLPNCGEDVQVLDNTFRHVADLDHAGEVTVYCLDDAGRPAVEELAHRYGFVYLSRPNKGEYKKASNLRYAYLRSRGDYVVVFDADFCPRRDFIGELMPYAQADLSVGIVQSPQYFEVRDDKSWLENGAGWVQEFFYRWVMPARDMRRSGRQYELIARPAFLASTRTRRRVRGVRRARAPSAGRDGLPRADTDRGRDRSCPGRAARVEPGTGDGPQPDRGIERRLLGPGGEALDRHRLVLRVRRGELVVLARLRLLLRPA